jgi:hypothetical protein
MITIIHGRHLATAPIELAEAGLYEYEHAVGLLVSGTDMRATRADFPVIGEAFRATASWSLSKWLIRITTARSPKTSLRQVAVRVGFRSLTLHGQ